MTALTVGQAESDLLGLLKGEFTSLSIGFNESHACNYCDARRYANEYDGPGEGYNDPDMWISPEDREAALAANQVWSLQWYQDTPVGFYRMCASSLPKLLEYVFSGEWRE